MRETDETGRNICMHIKIKKIKRKINRAGRYSRNMISLRSNLFPFKL